MKIKDRANKKIIVTVLPSLEGIEELDVTDWADQDLYDYMEDVDFGAAFEYNEEAIPIKRLEPHKNRWEDYTVPWVIGGTNRNHAVCKTLQEKIK